MQVGTLEEIIDDNHAIVSGLVIFDFHINPFWFISFLFLAVFRLVSTPGCAALHRLGPEYFVNIMSFVDKDQLEPGTTVLTHNKVSNEV